MLKPSTTDNNTVNEACKLSYKLIANNGKEDPESRRLFNEVLDEIKKSKCVMPLIDALSEFNHRAIVDAISVSPAAKLCKITKVECINQHTLIEYLYRDYTEYSLERYCYCYRFDDNGKVAELLRRFTTRGEIKRKCVHLSFVTAKRKVLSQIPLSARRPHCVISHTADGGAREGVVCVCENSDNGVVGGVIRRSAPCQG